MILIQGLDWEFGEDCISVHTHVLLNRSLFLGNRKFSLPMSFECIMHHGCSDICVRRL